MDNVVSINHKKENVLEFDLTMEGVENKGISVIMMVEAKDMMLGFKAEHKEKDKWSVTLPKLPMLERTAYKFHIMVHADGYHFEPFKGTLNVVGSAEVYSSEPKNVTLKSGNEEEKKEKTSKKEDTKKKTNEAWRGREKPIDQIARELMEGQKYSKEHIDKKVEEVREAAEAAGSEISKDEKVMAILEEAGITPKRKATRKSRFSFLEKVH